MTYRELTMMDVKELLRRWAAGHSNRKIARETGMSVLTRSEGIRSTMYAGRTASRCSAAGDQKGKWSSSVSGRRASRTAFL